MDYDKLGFHDTDKMERLRDGHGGKQFEYYDTSLT